MGKVSRSELARIGPKVGRKVAASVPYLNSPAVVRHRAEAAMVAKFKAGLGPFYRDVDSGPMQTTEVTRRTGVMYEKDLVGLANSDTFYAATYRHVSHVLDALEQCGVNLTLVGSVFELGCGGARLLREFRRIEGAYIVGSDIDSVSLDWCKEHLPDIEFHLNSTRPPLPFDDESFDLAIASSVFTHISLDAQQVWLDEMFRVMRPGSSFVCTVVGEYHIGAQLDGASHAELVRTGRFELKPGAKGLSLSSEVTTQSDVFQTRGEVIRVFGKKFQVLGYFRGAQDILVLRKPLTPGRFPPIQQRY